MTKKANLIFIQKYEKKEIIFKYLSPNLEGLERLDKVSDQFRYWGSLETITNGRYQRRLVEIPSAAFLQQHIFPLQNE